MIDARIIADSVNPIGNRITTWVVKFPRFILAEFNTHRMLSRNSSSSRAIPIEKIIQSVIDEPATPEFWGKNQKGMQASVELNEKEREEAKAQWLYARDLAVHKARMLQSMDVHKQIANRILEPWMHQTVLCTATEWENFFALRAESAAQPEFRALAFKMLDLYNSNEPKQLNIGEWHIPFGDKYCDHLGVADQLKVCTARAARVSYNNFEGDMDFQKDFDLHDKLLESGHLSPFEHCAKALPESIPVGNFVGWKQYRKFCKNENRTDSRVKKVAI